jgi:hypothetical protein
MLVTRAVLALVIACPSGLALGASAAESDTFVISAATGYGVEDCLSEGGECGRLVADAWCEEQGRGNALKFGRSLRTSGAETAASPAYFITCGN